jgi:hypothetical protein
MSKPSHPGRPMSRIIRSNCPVCAWARAAGPSAVTVTAKPAAPRPFSTEVDLEAFTAAVGAKASALDQSRTRRIVSAIAEAHGGTGRWAQTVRLRESRYRVIVPVWGLKAGDGRGRIGVEDGRSGRPRTDPR